MAKGIEAGAANGNGGLGAGGLEAMARIQDNNLKNKIKKWAKEGKKKEDEEDMILSCEGKLYEVDIDEITANPNAWD